jgi:thioredoxin reductase (NADPH)
MVGAGNSAGQAAVYLATVAKKVSLLVRGNTLAGTMSSYLCNRLAAQANIELFLDTEITDLEGRDGKLEAIAWHNRVSGVVVRRSIPHLFLLIGATPNTSWLPRCNVELDSAGFVCADANTANGRLPFETGGPGIFAIGDVRSGSVKRVAAAVGEGAQVVAAIHMYLAQNSEAKASRC